MVPTLTPCLRRRQKRGGRWKEGKGGFEGGADIKEEGRKREGRGKGESREETKSFTEYISN